MWEKIIVGIIVVAALAFVGHQLARFFSSSGSSCGNCPGCPHPCARPTPSSKKANNVNNKTGKE